MVWPQLASEYFELKWEERIAGAETIMKAARSGRAAVILGVQAPDVETAVKYAKHAAKLDPDALIAIPPRDADKEKLLEYYKAIGDVSLLPVFMQSVGDISVDEVIALAKQVPTLRYVKDEAGHTLSRIPQFRARAAGSIQGVFTGAHGKTLIDELARGAAGTMPAAGFTDLYVSVWDYWQAGRRAEALDAFGRLSLAISQVTGFNLASAKYWLQLRGVFKTTRCRGKNAEAYLDDEARRSIRATYDHLRPYLKA
jgi:4-hydroxy-tetrahydrodipicolinate synthase